MKEIKHVVLTDKEYAYVAVAMNHIKKTAQQALWLLFPTALSLLIFLCAAGIEVAIAYGVFSGLLQGIEDPVVEHSAGLLSLTAIVAMLTYHWISKDHPDAWPVRLIRNLSTIFAPFYVLAGGLFLGILLFPGAVATATTGTPDTIFGLPVEQADAGSIGQAIVTWLQDNMVLAAPFFVAGVMGISIMGLFVGGQCIGTIFTNASTIYHALSNQKIAKQAWGQFQTDINIYPKTVKAYDRLKNWTDSALRNKAALMIAGLAGQFVQRAESAIENNPALQTGNDEPDSALSRFFGKQPDLGHIKPRIETLKTLTAKNIRSVIDRNLK
ncbi:hypothetical protein C8R30_10918 [Nitrosomonas nitrosa]|uniref:hypothetical protein n=1 Tax=Nitrosomonas nitrosa TaxID=52442 RepID=UPI000D2FAA3C|nr:hypothetical protein [Nitrosomonas nitrosa]PTQ98741.1 hypothetical protein C8R30_10918 [Nitrosomonas nitrosa]